MTLFAKDPEGLLPGGGGGGHQIGAKRRRGEGATPPAGEGPGASPEFFF